MTAALQNARDRLLSNRYAFVLDGPNGQSASAESGLRAILSLLRDSPALLKGASAADTTVGKAAALLLVYGGVREVYAACVSEPARDVLNRAGVTLEYGEIVPYIRNRDRTDMCPMERKVGGVDDPAEAYRLFAAAL